MKKVLVMCMISAIILTGVLPATATTLDDLQKDKNNADSKLNSVTQKKNEVSNQITQKNNEIKVVDSQKKIEEKKQQDTQAEIDKLEADIKKIDQDIQACDDEYNKKNELFKTRLKIMYEDSKRSPLEVLLDSKSIVDLFSRVQLMAVIKKNDEELIRSVYLLKENTELAKKELTVKKEEIRIKLDEINGKVEKAKASRAKLVNDINSDTQLLKNLKAEEAKAIEDSNRVSASIKELISKGTVYKGNMSWPTPNNTSISSYYGNRLHPVYKVYKMHTGLDISAGAGVSILAANSGVVIYSGWQEGYGNTIIIDHGGGVTTLYGHCSSLLVKTGTVVESGKLIAKVGSTGVSTGPHLHFEVREDGATVDPLSYVSP